MSEDPRLPDKMEQNARVEVRKDGTTIGTRRIIDFLSSGSDADDSVNDIVSVVMSGGGSDFWEVSSVPGTGDADTLHPIATHAWVDIYGTQVFIQTPTSAAPGSAGQWSAIYVGDTDIVLEGGTGTTLGTDFSDIDLDVASGDLNILFVRDVNVEGGGDINIAADGTASGRSGDVNILAANNVNIAGSLDIRMDDNRTDQIALRAPASAPTTARMNNGSLSFYLDEGGNNLKVTVKYSGGTVKTATIPVV